LFFNKYLSLFIIHYVIFDKTKHEFGYQSPEIKSPQNKKSPQKGLN